MSKMTVGSSNYWPSPIFTKPTFVGFYFLECIDCRSHSVAGICVLGLVVGEKCTLKNCLRESRQRDVSRVKAGATALMVPR